MSSPDAEAQLQQELRHLFEVDTQKYLQLYVDTLAQLSDRTWKEDIQQIYRSVHTVKGGAVTVGAEAILLVATALEDLLSDLRYLDQAPPLADGELKNVLQEGGELLVASVQLEASSAAIVVQRINDLRTNVQQRYLPDWSEQSQLYQEFAEQGFDLVVLDLDMALEQLPAQGEVAAEVIDVAQQTMTQLTQIGAEMELAQGWQALLAQSKHIFDRPDCNHWRQTWPEYLQHLKESAKNGGKEVISQVSEATISAPNLIQTEEAVTPIAFAQTNAQTNTAIDPAAAELLELFRLDTQKDINTYFRTVDSLSETTWQQDIQQLYRSIHTIKGGAVTVGADAILQTAKVFEDLLSDLRYAEQAPPLADGNLQEILQELGELLVSALQMGAERSPDATVARIQQLHQQVSSTYLAEIDAQKQLAIEFANNGFDLVTLDLEMGVEQLPAAGDVPEKAIETATQTIAQLREIGDDLQFASDWQALLNQAESFATDANQNNQTWQQEWPTRLKQLKECARNVGKLPQKSKPVTPALPEPEVPAAKPMVTLTRPTTNAPGQLPLPPKPLRQSAKSATTPETRPAAEVQIPVPLERLDRSSQYLIETLMATRATQGFYQQVYAQLVPLVALAQDGVRYITQLREVQDDFALTETNNDPAGSPQVERYRQGYTAINRLLEISLRLTELGAETGEAARRTIESIESIDRSLRGLQQTIEESRLVPFESLALRARGILRDLTIRVGKPARLEVIGAKLELDAGTLRNLEPVLLHLIRNAYDHGIEAAEERSRLGKPATGRIELSLVRRGSLFVLTITDDGGGIDPEQITKAAIAKKLPLTDTSSPDKLLAVICQPGFTSTTAVSDISGRGVGMDVVQSQILEMGGQLSLRTQLNVGSSFVMQLPVPHLFVRCMLLQAGDRTFAVPTSEVFTTMLLGDLLWQKTTPSQAPLYPITVMEETGPVPALDLSQYWQGIPNPRSAIPTAIAVRTKRPDSLEGIWLVADNMLGQSDLLVNSLPDPLFAPIGMIGVSLQSDGRLIPVIDAPALIEALLSQASGDLVVTQPETEVTKTAAIAGDMSGLRARQILVVDDAALMRRRLEGSLSGQGYSVVTCSDGLEAWQWLQAHVPPALVITDIEMPGMDGFTLIDRCRQSGLQMPILVVSSRLAEEWSKETQRLGATDYLTKGFTTPDLLEKVATLIEEAAEQSEQLGDRQPAPLNS